MKAKTWRELRDLLNQADNIHLDKLIVYAGEETGGNAEVSRLSENAYIDTEDSYLLDESDWPNDVEKPEPRFIKGDFLLLID